MSVKLLTEHHLEFLSLKGGYTGLSESKFVKMSYYWKSHVAAHVCISEAKGGQSTEPCKTPALTGFQAIWLQEEQLFGSDYLYTKKEKPF